MLTDEVDMVIVDIENMSPKDVTRQNTGYSENQLKQIYA